MDNIIIDIARGVDVMRGSKVLAHFDGADALERANAKAAEAAGRYIRYWAVKPESKGE